ncbi:MAG: hypothetical protein AAGC66_11110 [Leifsonia sp.]
MKGRIGMWVLLGAAIVLILVGAGLLASAPVPSTFGWYAYSPLSDSAFSAAGTYAITPERAAGGGIAIVGLLLLVGVLAWVLGRRSGLRAGAQAASR